MMMFLVDDEEEQEEKEEFIHDDSDKLELHTRMPRAQAQVANDTVMVARTQAQVANDKLPTIDAQNTSTSCQR